jgi:hypothetical protein
MLLAGGWGPHGNSGVGVRTPWNHVDTSHSTPFETASEIDGTLVRLLRGQGPLCWWGYARLRFVAF